MSPIIGTLIVGLIWFGCGFFAKILLQGLLCEVLPARGEKFTFQYERRCNYFFWFGPFGLVMALQCYKAFGIKKLRIRFKMPEDLCKK